MHKSLLYYSEYLLKNFFFDKYPFNNSYRMPKVKTLYIHSFLSSSDLSMSVLYKYLLFFYCITGVRPLISIKKIKIRGRRGLRKKRVTNIFLSLTGVALFSTLFFIISRQLSLMKFFTFLPLKKRIFSATLSVPVNDDDFLLQALHIQSDFKFQISLSLGSSGNLQELRTFLVGCKVPICL